MSIGIWIVLGLLVACCVVPMLMMGRRGQSGSGGGKDTGAKDTGPQNR